VLRDGFPRRMIYLKRSYDPAWFCRVGRARGNRIDSPQLVNELMHLAGCDPPLQNLTVFLVSSRSFEKAVDQRLNVESRPAHNDWQTPPIQYLADDLAPLNAEFPGAEFMVRRDHIDKMMRDKLSLRRSRLRSPNIEVPVDLTGIGRDNLSAKQPCEMQRDLGFAGGCRTDKNEDVGKCEFCPVQWRMENKELRI
jgi:hypothetical protein